MSNTVNGDVSERSGDDEKVKAPVYKKIETCEPTKICILCQSSEIDALNLGEMYQLGKVVTHYFCLLFSSSLEQSGQDHEGILGFFPKDIQKEVKRGSRLRCSFCRKTGATIGCHVKACRKSFHLPCGLKHGTMHQFYDSFLSFCSFHRPSQTVDPKFLNKALEDEDASTCVICYEDVPVNVSRDTLWAPCCKKRWFHRCCLQRQALAQGYFFKCPMCNNKDEFNAEMRKFGIYIPEMDAAWEREPQAFQDLLTTYRTCDASKCKCPDGRNFYQNTGSWRLLRCNCCGSQGTHIVCSGLKIAAANNSWSCSMCGKVVDRANRRRSEERKTVTTPKSICSSPTSSVCSSGSSTNISSLRRPPADILETQVHKRRKSSHQSNNIDVPICSLKSPQADRSEQVCIKKEVVESNMSIAGPSENSSSDEDEIVIVDDLEDDSDIEVVDEVKPKNIPHCINTFKFSVSQKEVLTLEDPTIKVHKVTESSDVAPADFGAGQMKLPSEGEHSKTAQTHLLGQLQTFDYSVTKAPTLNSHISPSKTTYVISSPSTSEIPSSVYPQASFSQPQVTTPGASIMSVSTLDTSSTLGIKIDNVRHSNELFSASRTVQSPTLPHTPGTQLAPTPEPTQKAPLINQLAQLPHMPPIFYVTTQTADGQRAVQPMIPLSSLGMCQHLYQLQPQLNPADRSRVPADIVTLD